MDCSLVKRTTQIARFMWSTLGPYGFYRPQVGPVLAPWTLLSGEYKFGQDCCFHRVSSNWIRYWNYTLCFQWIIHASLRKSWNVDCSICIICWSVKPWLLARPIYDSWNVVTSLTISMRHTAERAGGPFQWTYRLSVRKVSVSHLRHSNTMRIAKNACGPFLSRFPRTWHIELVSWNIWYFALWYTISHV